MNLLRIPFIVIILLAFGDGGNSQERPKPGLVDEFSRIQCEDLRSRIDILLVELRQNLNYQGYAVIYGDADEMRINTIYEGMIRGHLDWRSGEFGPNRIKIVRAKLGKDLKIELWQIPKEAGRSFDEADWSFKITKKTKPFIFYSDPSGDNCPGDYSPEYFAEYLISNPSSKGNIVIRGGSSKEIANRKRKLIGMLVGKSKVPRNQLRFFFTEDSELEKDDSTAEYWFVP